MNQLQKITSDMYAAKGIRVKNNPLGLSVQDAQRAFDELSLDVIIPSVNSIADTQNAINTQFDNSINTLNGKAETAVSRAEVLTKTNIDAFTPTADYQPATKKYVDQNVIAGGVPSTRTVNGYPLSSDVILNANDVGAVSTNNASNVLPSTNGNASAGVSSDYSRADHVHPCDATKLDKPTRITTGTSIAIEDNKEYMLTGVNSLTFTYPTGNFECWIKLTAAASGTITITFPASSYIGIAPTFKANETWEISIKDGVVIAQKVGDGQ